MTVIVIAEYKNTHNNMRLELYTTLISTKNGTFILTIHLQNKWDFGGLKTNFLKIVFKVQAAQHGK